MEEELFCFPSQMASHRLILLHGWGADAEDLIPLGQNLINSLEKNVELISLRAPHVHPEGIGRQWYGLFPANWTEAQRAVSDLQIRLHKLSSPTIPLEKTVLLGFSQGGAMALAAGAKMELSGLIGCSAYPHPDLTESETNSSVFLTHGAQDEIVPKDASVKLFELFERNRCKPELYIFKGGHEIPIEVYSKLKIFLEKCFQ